RHIEPLEEPPSLLLLRHIQQQLDDLEPVVAQIPLPFVDLAVPLVPDPLAPAARRQPLPVQVLRMDPDDEYLLVVRPVEDADLAPGRRGPRVAPQVVVTE